MDRSFYLFLLCLLCGTVFANIIEVTNMTLTGQNSGNGTTQIQFDLGWENSWRISVGPANYDAAWVFAKYRVNNGAWRHCTLNTGGSSAPGGVVISVEDNLGAFIHRSADGSGDVDWQDLQLQWNYGADGVSDADIVDVQVFATEMVYVPQAAFSLGSVFSDRDTLSNEFYRVAIPSQPYPVTSEAAITVGTSSGNLYYPEDIGGAGDRLGPIPAAFPKGYGAFYCMKYEVSQDQWVAFFNTLSDAAKVTNDITAPGTGGKGSDNEGARNGISWGDAGNAVTTLPNVAMNYVSNARVLAFLDWAGLRPMTELEFEKACRGTAAPVAGEFAWGTAAIATQEYVLVNSGTATEHLSNPAEGVGNATYDQTSDGSGPNRVGIHAASAVNQTREESGGSYYGIMELSGNVYERAISVGNPAGRAFAGSHGDGTLASSGVHDVLDWPSTDTGFSYRGAGFYNRVEYLRVADRRDGATVSNGGNNRIGFRGVRTAN
ncbi:formylglycine-generating enzyme family protein [Lewinella sp. IMCC34191]|uniref:formylglycine-generating enzyme family protein n=1 Tax=Lewinella sp. IMCC34191 TaxID=2259172 RepID=UPI000E276506|nr:SUMF1/EgtB/PvdO family nonheme iron enzyme [Lewinella sp. IMCC34191]